MSELPKNDEIDDQVATVTDEIASTTQESNSATVDNAEQSVDMFADYAENESEDVAEEPGSPIVLEDLNSEPVHELEPETNPPSESEISAETAASPPEPLDAGKLDADTDDTTTDTALDLSLAVGDDNSDSQLASDEQLDTPQEKGQTEDQNAGHDQVEESKESEPVVKPVKPVEPVEPVVKSVVEPEVKPSAAPEAQLLPSVPLNRHDSVSSAKSGLSYTTKSLKNWFNIKLKSANTSRDNITSNSDDMTTDTAADEEDGDFVDINSITSTASDILSSEENYDLLLYRLHDNHVEIGAKSAKDREQLQVGRTTIRNTFNEIRQGIHHTNNDELIQKIDWEFWSDVVNGYSDIVKHRKEELRTNICNGIPKELRGMVWQLIANSKSFNLEELFTNLKLESSQHERAIKRDLSRTRFMNTDQVKDKAQEVFNIIKLYSLYDPEVGYTQGMAFLTVPLLMNMSESETFCLLVLLMKNYNFRSLYLPEMPGLVLKLYQFDRLLEDSCPGLFYHLQRQGIRASMYLTQWFLTLFGYKFPLEMVLRIYDLVVLEGMETILKFAINLMVKNECHLVSLGFDDLLRFLKEEIFEVYLKEATEGGDDLQYRLDDLVKDSMEIKVLPIILKKYEQEFEEVNRLEKERQDEIELLRNKNGQLTMDIRKLEVSYSLLNKEHVEIANEMIQGKMKIATLEDENKNLKLQIETMTLNLNKLESELDSPSLQKDVDLEINKTMQRNLEVMEMNRVLEEQLGDLELSYNSLSKKYDSLSNEHGNLKSRLRNLMG